jgi:hypothetical protein
MMKRCYRNSLFLSQVYDVRITMDSRSQNIVSPCHHECSKPLHLRIGLLTKQEDIHMPSSLKFSSEGENRYWLLADLVAKSGPGVLLLEGDMKPACLLLPYWTNIMDGSDQHGRLKAAQHLDQFEQQRQHPEGADGRAFAHLVGEHEMLARCCDESTLSSTSE